MISLTFAPIREDSFEKAYKQICRVLVGLYTEADFLVEEGFLQGRERQQFLAVRPDMDETSAVTALHDLSGYLSRYYGKKVIILLDEYDTPMQEAYVHNYWERLVEFTRNLFDHAFKTNPYLERAFLTGTTRISKESVFSGLNNLRVVTTTSDLYATSFGFTEAEVFSALEEYGMGDRTEEAKAWDDGFRFGQAGDIYNPWSVIGYLSEKKPDAYWVNTSSHKMIDRLVRTGGPELKLAMEDLLAGKAIRALIDEQIVFDQLDSNVDAVWSLLLASGYLKVLSHEQGENGDWYYMLALTNREVYQMFRRMIGGWFGRSRASYSYNSFIRALLAGDTEAMNDHMNDVAVSTFSFFDMGDGSEGRHAENFYHGFVLGLTVDLQGRYLITSNRESGYGRYDVMLEPRDEADPAVILEFKVYRGGRETGLEDTVAAALRQIEEKGYDAQLTAKGIRPERIRHYGSAFQGKGC